MIAETALRLAGPGAHLVRRPAGVLHLYVGPLTASGRYVPRAGRATCRAHTRRLAVLPLSERCSSLDPASRLPRLCARCSARLTAVNARRAELITRFDYLRAYHGTTQRDLAFALEIAETAAEVDQAAHLTLVLFGHTGCQQPVHRGRTLHQHVEARRGHYAQPSENDRLLAALVAGGTEQRKAERAALYADRERRIRELGISNVKPI